MNSFAHSACDLLKKTPKIWSLRQSLSVSVYAVLVFIPGVAHTPPAARHVLRSHWPLTLCRNCRHL